VLVLGVLMVLVPAVLTVRRRISSTIALCTSGTGTSGTPSTFRTSTSSTSCTISTFSTTRSAHV
jgi:hypothetical protein